MESSFQLPLQILYYLIMLAFIITLSTGEICKRIKSLRLRNLHNDESILVTQEVFKMFMDQIFLKNLVMGHSLDFQDKLFTTRATNCLRNLSRLSCHSSIDSEFLYQMSQTCHNIQSLKVIVRKIISDGLTDFISVQRNLKSFELVNHVYNTYDWTKVITD